MSIDLKYDPSSNFGKAKKIKGKTDYYVGASKICPLCDRAILGYPALSRIDNRTEICQNCGMIESLQVLKKYEEHKCKEIIKSSKMKKVTKDNLLKLVELKTQYIQTKDEEILKVINDYITNVINKDKQYYSKLKGYNFSDDILKYLL